MLQNTRAAGEPSRGQPAGWLQVSAVQGHLCLLSSVPAAAQAALSSCFPSRQNCFERIHGEYAAVILAAALFILALGASVLHLGLLWDCFVLSGALWLDVSGRLQSCSASLEGWFNEGERESRHLHFVSKQVCCLKFHCLSGPSF